MEDKNQEVTTDGEKHETNTGMAIVAYLLFFVPLLTDSKDDPFVKFHVKQSLTILSLAVALYVLRIFLFYIPFLGIALIFIYPLISLGLFALIVIGIYNALNSKMKELPLIGKYADKLFKF